MRDALLATVTEEVAAVQAFESLLVDEEKALIAAQPLPALPEIIENKTALTERISALEKARDEQLKALGFPGGFVGISPRPPSACSPSKIAARRPPSPGRMGMATKTGSRRQTGPPASCLGPATTSPSAAGLGSSITTAARPRSPASTSTAS